MRRYLSDQVISWFPGRRSIRPMRSLARPVLHISFIFSVSRLLRAGLAWIRMWQEDSYLLCESGVHLVM